MYLSCNTEDIISEPIVESTACPDSIGERTQPVSIYRERTTDIIEEKE